ncbi:MAG: metallophosphoesterase [Bacteroidales bacterium]|jgi:5'-nucleotidase|nr:metallophosphoesterase [Bacteroidales bacterium]
MIMKKTLTFFAALLLAFTSAQGQDLVILHTNDTHSQIEPLASGNYKGLGGVVRREKYINQVRAENKNVILLDAGDFSQGTPYFTLFRGDVEVELMNALKVDVATFGNHEFDNGQEELARRIKMAAFPVVNANYDFKGTALEGLIPPYAIVERGGKRIGIIGLSVQLASLVSPSRLGKMKYQHPYKIVNRLARKLRNREKCDLVILLTHCGFNDGTQQNPSDQLIAANTEGVDIIIGGHSHTFIKQPAIVESKTGKKVMIVQAGAKGEEVGRIDIWF